MNALVIDVFLLRYVFQVFGAVVVFVAIKVGNHKPQRSGPKKCQRNQRMKRFSVSRPGSAIHKSVMKVSLATTPRLHFERAVLIQEPVVDASRNFSLAVNGLDFAFAIGKIPNETGYWHELAINGLIFIVDHWSQATPGFL
ncbi:MAG: hypothetical protein QF521_23780 [Alphaproteobacteria bacterium]|jgi:hypothetical protein|nr:hypothetical protein [Alphaproteobacteria bacterium]